MSERISNISNILDYFKSLDKSGKSNEQIDTVLECEMLGQFLNGSQVCGTQFTNLKKKEQNKIQKLYNEVKQSIQNAIGRNDDSIIKISDDNIQQYVELYDKESHEYENYNNEKVQILAKALYRYCTVEQGYDLEEITDNDYTFDFKYIIGRIKNRNANEYAMRKKGEIVIERINNPYDNNVLKENVENYVINNNIPDLDKEKYKTDIGNGKFDKIATQKTNLCWAHAAINGFLQTDEGEKLLESNKYYDKKTGVFAIHLQEAEDNGFHHGIYIITPEDIANEGINLSDGEGDTTAYMIALKKYFDEIEENPKLKDKMNSQKHVVQNVDQGNVSYRFFEIITGGQTSQLGIWNDSRIQNGINNGSSGTIQFKDISDVIMNHKGAVVMSVGGHAISVIGIKGDKLLVQESNNSEQFSEDYKAADRPYNPRLFKQTESINGALTYELSKDDFESYIEDVSMIKWK